jgi:DNA-binding response OmpR family regulator
VEDEPDIAALMQRQLAVAGYNADIVHDANEARQRLQERPGQYRAMTIDIVLPGENGLSLLEGLRQDEATRDIPIVIVSANADEARRELNGGAIGVVDWLSKPFDEQRLVNAVKQATDPARLPRVLHVEDESSLHTVINSLLQERCDLTWAASLSESKKRLQTEEFDLVLLDINLPDGSGLDLLEVIEHCAIPPRVVIFSAYDVTEEYADKVNAVLVKSKTDNFRLAEIIGGVIGQG